MVSATLRGRVEEGPFTATMHLIMEPGGHEIFIQHLGSRKSVFAVGESEFQFNRLHRFPFKLLKGLKNEACSSLEKQAE